MTAPAPDPALDGPDAERAIGAACLRMGEPTTTAWSADFLAALNDRDVVLCDERLLTELLRRATDAEAEVQRLRVLAARMYYGDPPPDTAAAVAEQTGDPR